MDRWRQLELEAEAEAEAEYEYELQQQSRGDPYTGVFDEILRTGTGPVKGLVEIAALGTDVGEVLQDKLFSTLIPTEGTSRTNILEDTVDYLRSGDDVAGDMALSALGNVADVALPGSEALLNAAYDAYGEERPGDVVSESMAREAAIRKENAYKFDTADKYVQAARDLNLVKDATTPGTRILQGGLETTPYALMGGGALPAFISGIAAQATEEVTDDPYAPVVSSLLAPNFAQAIPRTLRTIKGGINSIGNLFTEKASRALAERDLRRTIREVGGPKELEKIAIALRGHIAEEGARKAKGLPPSRKTAAEITQSRPVAALQRAQGHPDAITYERELAKQEARAAEGLKRLDNIVQGDDLALHETGDLAKASVAEAYDKAKIKTSTAYKAVDPKGTTDLDFSPAHAAQKEIERKWRRSKGDMPAKLRKLLDDVAHYGSRQTAGPSIVSSRKGSRGIPAGAKGITGIGPKVKAPYAVAQDLKQRADDLIGEFAFGKGTTSVNQKASNAAAQLKGALIDSIDDSARNLKGMTKRQVKKHYKADELRTAQGDVYEQGMIAQLLKTKGKGFEDVTTDSDVVKRFMTAKAEVSEQGLKALEEHPQAIAQIRKAFLKEVVDSTKSSTDDAISFEKLQTALNKFSKRGALNSEGKTGLFKKGELKQIQEEIDELKSIASIETLAGQAKTPEKRAGWLDVIIKRWEGRMSFTRPAESAAVKHKLREVKRNAADLRAMHFHEAVERTFNKPENLLALVDNPEAKYALGFVETLLNEVKSGGATAARSAGYATTRALTRENEEEK